MCSYYKVLPCILVYSISYLFNVSLLFTAVLLITFNVSLKTDDWLTGTTLVKNGLKIKTKFWMTVPEVEWNCSRWGWDWVHQENSGQCSLTGKPPKGGEQKDSRKVVLSAEQVIPTGMKRFRKKSPFCSVRLSQFNATNIVWFTTSSTEALCQ